MRRSLVGLGLAVAVSASFGCGGSSIEAVCDEICACTQCDDPDYDACVDQLQGELDSASANGCGDPYDSLLSCAADRGTCAAAGFDAGACVVEAEAVSSCVPSDASN